MAIDPLFQPPGQAPDRTTTQTPVRERVVTGIALAVPAIVLLWIGGTPLIVVATVVYAVCAFEFYRVVFPAAPALSFLGMLSAAFPVAGYLFDRFEGFCLGLLSAAVVQGVAVVLKHRQRAPNFATVFPFAIGLFLPVVLASSLVIAAELGRNTLWVLWLVLGVVASDTFAYFGGRYFRGPKLAPALSPNKTISGAICGFIGSFLTLVGAGFGFGLPLSHELLILGAISISFIAPIGDLLGSLVKRLYDAKDYGSVLPGHGGVLDRVVALLFAAPVLMLLIYISENFSRSAH